MKNSWLKVYFEIISDMASYKLDQNVSVFETNIRILGGLLSAHILALDRRRLGITEAFLNIPPHLPYDGKLLDLAVDLGDRVDTSSCLILQPGYLMEQLIY